MAVETSTITAWTLVQEIPIPADVTDLLMDGEQAVAAYKTFRDSAIFTTKRLIVRDAQGLTGKKIEVYSLPYSSINMWSSENAGGMLDRDAELELWTRAGHIKVKLQKKLDIRRLDKLIAWAVLKRNSSSDSAATRPALGAGSHPGAEQGGVADGGVGLDLVAAFGAARSGVAQLDAESVGLQERDRDGQVHPRRQRGRPVSRFVVACDHDGAG